MRFIFLDEHHDTPDEIVGYVGDLLDALVEYDPERFTGQEIHDYYRTLD